jgi:hypothetical protein
MPNLPGPIKVTLTVKEAAATHLILEALIQVHSEAPDLFAIETPILRRAAKAIENELKKSGCKYDKEGWHT